MAKKRTGNPPGRPTKLTDELEEEICNLLLMGNFLETAAGACGVDAFTVRRWMKAGARGQSYGRHSKARMARFCASVKEAMRQAEASLVQDLRMHAAKDFRAVQFHLRCMNPEKWNPRDEVDVTSGGEAFQPVQVVAVSPFAAMGQEDDDED